jgi:tRNA(Ile2) C34 agmatinyltransferase TiaS
MINRSNWRYEAKPIRRSFHKVTKPCLCCDESFESEGKNNRVCPRCNAVAQEGYYHSHHLELPR